MAHLTNNKDLFLCILRYHCRSGLFQQYEQMLEDMVGPGEASRNGPLAARSGQRAEPAVTERDRLAMNSPPGSAVPNSHDFSERLVADTNAASDAEV